MPCPGVGPCEVWDLDLSCCLSPSGNLPDPCMLEGNPVPQDVIDSAKKAASEFLWMKTGKQFGCCTVKLRPCRQCSKECCTPFIGDSNYGYGAFPWFPVHLANGDWTNVACGCQDECSCFELCKIKLPYPVCSVDEVRIDGEAIDPENFTVYGFEELVWTNPVSGCWPECNNLNLPDTEPGTWSVTVTYGRPVPELVRRAANELACEFIKHCQGAPCRLPQRISSVSRQGVSVSFLDPMEFMGEGFTGIYAVDLAIKTYNPHGIMSRPVVYSPDVAKKWKVETWRPGDGIGPGCT